MRKLALLIVLMMVMALTTYAADIEVSVSGKAELTFGVNLNDPVASGFTNYSESKINFTLVSGDSKKGSEEDGAVYGYIQVTGWKVAVKDTAWDLSDGDVEAKIMFPMGWVKISGTNNSLNYIEIVQNDNGDKDNADKGIQDSLAASGGFVVGLNFAPVSVELGIFSENDWTDATETPAVDDLNDEHAYGVNLKLVADIAPIKIEGGVEMGLGHSDEGIGAGAKVSANIAPITVYAGLDITIDGTVNVMEYGFGASLAIAGITVTADGSYNEAPDGLDVRAKIDAGGLVPGLGLALTVEMFNLTGAVGADLDDDAEMAIIVDLSYATATIKPYANVRYGTYTTGDNAYTYVDPAVTGLTVGAELYLIPNVTFDAKYSSSNLETDKGTITFLTKIAL